MNVFKTLLNNLLFWLILLGEFAFQFYMIWAAQFPLASVLLGTAPLSQGQIITCWFFGVIPLAIYPAMKKVPLEHFAFMNKYFDLEEDHENSFASQAINKYKEKVE